MSAELQTNRTNNTITLSREYNTTKERLFSMFKNPEHLAKWWGPKMWPATIASFEFAPGGVWHYYMTGPDGTKAWGKATFVAIDEPNSLTFMDAFSDENGTANPDLPQGTVTFTFEETDGSTTLRMTGEYATEADAEKVVEMGMLEGMKDTWSQLAELVEN